MLFKTINNEAGDGSVSNVVAVQRIDLIAECPVYLLIENNIIEYVNAIQTSNLNKHLPTAIIY